MKRIDRDLEMNHRSALWMINSVLNLILVTICLLGSLSCAIIDDKLYSPRLQNDYDSSEGDVLEFKTGDHFKTLKPMFLIRPTGTWLYLANPGIGAPSLEMYKEDPSKFRWVLRLVPSGTDILIVGIKGDAPTVYTQLDGQSDWIAVPLRASGIPLSYMKQGHTYYDREFFRKVK